MFDFKTKVIKLLEKFPIISPMDLVRLDKYYVEYLRELAKKNWIDPEREYKWTNKVIKIYSDKWYDCVWDALTIIQTLKEMALLMVNSTRWSIEWLVAWVVNPDEKDVLKCLYNALTNDNKKSV